jgi:hypothetical protein
MRLMGTTEAVGTHPEGIVRGARALGFDAEAKENLTLDELKRFTDLGHPVIALGQVWRSRKASPGSPRDEWDSGHWFVVLGVDQDYVYTQDPYARMAKMIVPRQAFEEHWHQIMGGKEAGNPKIERCAIFVRGKAPPPAAEETVALPDISFETMGSVSLVTVRFKEELLPYDFMAELAGALPRQAVRADAFIFLRRDRQGRLFALEGGQMEDEQDVVQVNALIAAIAVQSLGEPSAAKSKAEAAVQAAAAGDFGLSAADLKRMGESVPPGESAMVLLFENLWERQLKQLAARYGGTLARQRLIPSDALVRLGQSLRTGGDPTIETQGTGA